MYLELLGEPVLRPECPDGGDARDGLAEVQVDRRLGARLEPLHLPRRRDEHPGMLGLYDVHPVWFITDTKERTHIVHFKCYISEVA